MPTTLELMDAPFLADASDWLLRLEAMPHLALFDSCHFGGDEARYHIITGAPQQWLRLQENRLTHVTSEGAGPATEIVNPAAEVVWQFIERMQAPVTESDLPFCGGLVGLLGYEFGRLCELNAPSRSELPTPDLVVGRYSWALVQDIAAKKATLCFQPDCPAALRKQVVKAVLSDSGGQPIEQFIIRENNSLRADVSEDSYHKAFCDIQQYLHAGDCYQINFTQRFSNTSRHLHPIALYRKLRASLPGPMAGYLALDEASNLHCLSPERLVSCDKGVVLAQPIKGTIARSQNAEEDAMLARQLIASQKDQAENLMIVDLLRNDMSKVCKAGSVKVPALFELQSFENVHHLVSSITGELSEHSSPLAALRAVFPGGSITGAPKKRAMEIIDELEAHSREAYCGSLFYWSANNKLDANITIRSVLQSSEGLACWGGGGITVGSEAHAEYQESITKVSRLIQRLSK
ncbi:anthranilate synthase component I family protein [Simiduia sp. 21SJ11W-1]|uniref:anthranilate synthase component I family protein n=1 Tax=Simiduia sp. 21SJ11W-1 TaxID=2909669 RepID=UPI00209F43D9|nr:anthranilate synthase component I family protein [Simiduia sp. 21SJ11W-1]UTA49602.1 anthranilate synthase component I family protein [Simiduia sp. 21SJ11W-1]